MKILIEIMEQNLASKNDIKELASKDDMRSVDFKLMGFENSLNAALKNFEYAVERVEYRMTIKLGTLMGVA